MIRVAFDPDTLEGEAKDWWANWSKKAQTKMDAYCAKRDAEEECELDGGIWSELKSWLLAHVFHKKCAYCEARITGTSFGDGEHYRPKGKVTVGGPDGKTAAIAKTGDPHGGYYWLAYDWRNLVPTCNRCNNAKSDLFEVAEQHDATPGATTLDLNAAEAPLLIHPYFDDPSQYLRFGKAGVVTAIDGNPRGEATIRMLGLDRQDLTDERWEQQSLAVVAMATTLAQMIDDEDAGGDRIAQYTGPAAPFSRAVYDRFEEQVRIATERALAIAAAAQAEG